MTTLKTLTAAAALLTIAGTAHADLHMTGQFGYWTTLAGTSKDKTTHMCVAGVSNNNRDIVVKWQQEQKMLVLEIHKATWSIPEGQPITVVLQVDQAPTMTFKGEGGRDPSGGGVITVTIDPDENWDFSGKPLGTEMIKLLMEGKKASLYFPTGNEQPWDASLTGSTAALFSWAQCINTNHAQTQPFSASPAIVKQTQPF